MRITGAEGLKVERKKEGWRSELKDSNCRLDFDPRLVPQPLAAFRLHVPCAIGEPCAAVDLRLFCSSSVSDC